MTGFKKIITQNWRNQKSRVCLMCECHYVLMHSISFVKVHMYSKKYKMRLVFTFSVRTQLLKCDKI